MIPSWETRLEIYEKWRSGQTQKSIGKEYGLSDSRISSLCLDTKIRIQRGWNPRKEEVRVGRPSTEKRKTSVNFDPDVWEKVKNLGWGERSKFINQAIREYLNR